MPAPEPLAFSAPGSFRRVRLVAQQTLAEALRLRLTWLLGLAGVMLVVMAVWIRTLNFGASELKFIADFGLGAISLLGMLLAALATAHLFFSDLTGGMIGCVLTRTVRRWEFIAGKVGGVLLLLALFVSALSIVLAVIVALRSSELGTTFIPPSTFLLACALVWLKTALVAAITLLVCSYADSSLFASCAGLMLAVVGHLRPFADTAGGFAWLRLWPNLGLFDVEPLLAGASVAWPGLAVYWLGFMTLFIGLASYVFKQREF